MSTDKLVPTAYRSAGFGLSAVAIDHRKYYKQLVAARSTPLRVVGPSEAGEHGRLEQGSAPETNLSSVAA